MERERERESRVFCCYALGWAGLPRLGWTELKWMIGLWSRIGYLERVFLFCLVL